MKAIDVIERVIKFPYYMLFGSAIMVMAACIGFIKLFD